MQERESGRPQPSDPRGQRAGQDWSQDYAERDTKSMTTRSATAPQQEQAEWSGSESGGAWSGYVVPYRYYGPGYRGVGYYTVLYQGRGEAESDSDSQYAQRATGYAQSPGWDARAGAIAGSQAGRGFAGRGPKGYQRSDERLREEVSDRLMADDQIDASDVEVEVHNGEVTLTGSVDGRLAKRRAEDCAEEVMGVRDVMNQLRVPAPPSESGGVESRGLGMASGSGSRQASSPQQAESDGGLSAEDRSTGANGRRQTASSRR
jgi:osmotically-inducible protein OsmY